MKLLALLCTLATTARAASWYVAPHGDDSAEGTLAAPFATLQRAQTSAEPGDTVLLRGGTYEMQQEQIAKRQRGFAYLTDLTKSGQPGKPITYRNYESERPVFDCTRVAPYGLRVDAFHITGSWLHLIGLEVTEVQVTNLSHTQSICFENNGSHNIYERLSMHDGQAIGIYSTRGSDNLFLNCDAWNNWDYTSEDGKGGNVDGFGCHPTQGSTGNVFRGCRAWYNSDDGYDCIGAHESVTFENCWAAYNGLSPKHDRLGDGNGFKAGGYGSMPAADLPNPIPRHIVRQCVSVGNKASGFYSNHHPDGSDWLNNSAYRNGTNFNMLCRLANNRTDVDGFGHVLTNNLSYKSKADLSRIDKANCKLTNNTFGMDLQLTDKDFESVDEKELFEPRQADGSLPVIHFLHPTKGSALSDAGIGAFE